MIKMEIANLDLEKLISRNLTLTEKRDLLLQMLTALYSLKIKKINHLDIKPANILVVETDNSFKLKLSDFGESRQSSSTLAHTAARGTLCYMSPELLLIYS